MTHDEQKFTRGNDKSDKTTTEERIERTVDSFRTEPGDAALTPHNDNTVRPRNPDNDDFQGASSSLLPRAINAVMQTWSGGLEPFAAIEDLGQQNKFFIGPRVKLDQRNGRFVKPQTDEEIDMAIPYKPVSARRSWILYDDNSEIVNRIDEEPGARLPNKSALPPVDGCTWKISVYIAFTDPDVYAPWTFYSSAGGAYDAAQGLLQRIKAHRRQRPDGQPLVRIASVYQEFKTGRRGFWTPTFTLAEWETPDGSRVSI